MIGKSKTPKNDYTPAMLPQTRKAIFFDVLQLHWKKLLLLGLIGLLLFLPLLLSTVVKDVYIANLYAALTHAGDGEQQAAAQSLVHLNILRSLINTLFLVVYAVAFSGTARVLRQYAWMENVHIPTDLGKGIRDNFGQTAAIAVLAGLIYTLCLTVYHTASAYTSDLMSSLAMVPIALSVLLVLPVFAIALVMVPVYSNRLWTTLKNAFFVYTRCFFRVMAGLFLCLLIWIPAMLPNFYCHIFGSLFANLLTPMALLGWTLFCYNLFDRHLNPLVCPELIGKGIHSPSK